MDIEPARNWRDGFNLDLSKQTLPQGERHSMRKGERRKIPSGIVQVKLYAPRTHAEQVGYVLHRPAVGRPGKALALAVRERNFPLTAEVRKATLRTHMRMEIDPNHVQKVLRALNEAVKSETSIVHCQRKRRELTLSGRHSNRQPCPDSEAQCIVEHAALFRRFCASRTPPIPHGHGRKYLRLLKNGIDLIVALVKIMISPLLRITRD